MNYIYKHDGSLVLFVNSQVHTIDPTAVNYDVVLNAVKSEDWDTVRETLDVRSYVADYSNGHVEIAGDNIYFDRIPVKGEMATRMIQMFRNGFNIDPMVGFLENLRKNPDESSRDELFEFMEKNDLPITPDGHFLAYKRVKSDYMDCHSGTIRNMIGDRVTMSRADVDSDRYHTCSDGLHFCSYEYVKHFWGDHLMVLKINPKDVVSIPVDYNNAKGRCCEYLVVDEIKLDEKINDTYVTNEFGWEDDDWEDDDWEDDGWETLRDDFVENDPRHPTESVADQITHAGTALTAKQVREIRDLVSSGRTTLAAIARTYGVSPRTIGRIRDFESYSWVD